MLVRSLKIAGVFQADIHHQLQHFIARLVRFGTLLVLGHLAALMISSTSVELRPHVLPRV